MLLSEASMIKETSGLIEEISVRQTNRGIYSGEMIPSDQLSYLRIRLWRKISVCICGRKESGSSIRFLLIYLRGITGK